MFDPILLLLTIVFMVIGTAVSGRLKSRFAKYSQVPTTSGMTGAQVAKKMLHDNGIYDVKIQSVEGQLTDHYNPATKIVNLSTDVYHGQNVSAAAVAAHECGHAVQHATGYQWLQMRSKLVPVVQLSSTLMNFMFIFTGIFAVVTHFYDEALLFVIILQSAITLFSLITLPVEIDASRRALAWLDSSGITRGTEHEYATDALKWAAGTYVVSALASVATLLYWVMRYMGSRRD